MSGGAFCRQEREGAALLFAVSPGGISSTFEAAVRERCGTSFRLEMTACFSISDGNCLGYVAAFL
jgi:hypothetical protein